MKEINGIDVNECEKLGETIDGFTCGLGKRIRFANEIITKHNLCKDNPDCYFKQLKRLQEKYNTVVNKFFNSETDKTRLQEENEELKDRNANLRLNLATYDLPKVKKVLTDWRTGELDIKFKKLQKENEELKKEKEKIEEDAEYFLNGDYCDEKCNSAKNELKYKQALEEIREIISDEIDKTDKDDELIQIYGTIFNKCNEALNDRD